MREKIQAIVKSFEEAIKKVETSDELAKLHDQYLGRQDGELVSILRQLKNVAESERPVLGQMANEAKKRFSELWEQKKNNLSSHKQGLNRDLTLPGNKISFGRLHPLTQSINQLADIFSSLGFEITEAPEIDTDYYNFEALNIPPFHPAREMQDTFYVASSPKEKLVLRTHTSNAQVRYMEKRVPPLRACTFGRCYRRDATDASHEHTFYQVEGFAVDQNISIGNLIYTMKAILGQFFGKKLEIRLRPSFFSFTEPSYEVDFECLNCQGKGCSICKKSGWLEIFGAGMIHPNVLKHAGYPANKYSGFAFGGGIDRLAMLKYGIDDIRLFHSGDLRFIKQF